MSWMKPFCCAWLDANNDQLMHVKFFDTMAEAFDEARLFEGNGSLYHWGETTMIMNIR